MARQLTPETWAQIRYDYEHTDRPVEDICAEHGISSGTLRNRMRRWHWTRRRSAIPREGPPAFLIVDGTIAPSGPATIVAQPATRALAPDARAATPALQPAVAEPAPLSPALQAAVKNVLPAIQQTLRHLAEGRSHPDDAGKTARALETLTRTLRELSVLSSRQRGRR